MNSIGTKIKEIRLKKGLSQEELAEKSQMSLRTIQRIENNENEPRGKTMQLICESLGANIEELLDYDKKEDLQFLMFFHLSVLCGIAIPTGNIILPLVLWLTKKDKIQGLQKMGAKLLNFQILWTCLSFLLPVLYLIAGSQGLFDFMGEQVSSILNLKFAFYINLFFGSINYIAAVILAIANRNGKQITYPSIIPMIQ
ncbi:XRE family transcriptional regulator [Nonlabens sp. MB-3u-79]|jgi:transcriptional regulator with XRE-family HTH domain|uniref:helix-turn-helix domain-containing protein n=1 Tax=Nonlabens sp. MB-3u-79 TaxID=2058134 RepID=UPI000C302E94|nr:helix-turn-helix domain-containing protein [Nonlabens sp. MB-3u-79]AUC78326.1 XRE family transcriptional regulator [Nonlabens sp. MB-3u-79]